MHACARVVELVDTRDLKSLGLTAVPVQVRVRVPYLTLSVTRLSSHLPFFSVSSTTRLERLVNLVTVNSYLSKLKPVILSA